MEQKLTPMNPDTSLQQALPVTEEIMEQTMQNLSATSPIEEASEEDNGMAIAKQFLEQNYEFQYNVLSDKLEYRLRDGQNNPFCPLTPEAENSIILKACLELGNIKGLKSNIKLIIHSEERTTLDPAMDWINSLPKWDGINRVAELFGRLPGITSEQIWQCTVWFRSAFAHWEKLDTLHGNETVPVLIGDQGCGKTVFCRRLLPPHLQQYFLDHLNLSNKFDKDMAFSNNLIVVLDELDQYTVSQQAALKQALSKNTINGRPIFGKTQKDRHRYASFLATTNNPHPLNDPTGSRRYICIRLTEGALIDNEKPIDYEQLYAQLKDEVNVKQLPYWFSAEETRRIQEANVPFQAKADVDEIVKNCFRLPADNEVAMEKSMDEIMGIITHEYPLLKVTHGLKIRVGQSLKRYGYKDHQRNTGMHYFVIPKKAA